VDGWREMWRREGRNGDVKRRKEEINEDKLWMEREGRKGEGMG